MAKTKKVVEVDAETVVATKATRDTGSVVVSWRGNTREYTRDIHGEGYRALAESFAGKVGGELV